MVDVVAAATALVASSPLLGAAAIAVRRTGPGPTLFVQERTGRNGRPFRAYKLRTMRTTHRHDPSEVVPIDHPNVTPVGRWLRRFKIDELPQLFNVLRGDMSLIGPRPAICEKTAAYDDVQRQRLLLRPGLTGLAQVNGNAAIPWEERIKYDVYYVHHESFGLDMSILARTLWVLLRGDEALARPFAASPYARSTRLAGPRKPPRP
jgi:lipopolysaccharide/colanic/teichoic acid biosynthesis glycosyltransferase